MAGVKAAPEILREVKVDASGKITESLEGMKTLRAEINRLIDTIGKPQEVHVQGIGTRILGAKAEVEAAKLALEELSPSISGQVYVGAAADAEANVLYKGSEKFVTPHFRDPRSAALFDRWQAVQGSTKFNIVSRMPGFFKNAAEKFGLKRYLADSPRGIEETVQTLGKGLSTGAFQADEALLSAAKDWGPELFLEYAGWEDLIMSRFVSAIEDSVHYSRSAVYYYPNLVLDVATGSDAAAVRQQIVNDMQNRIQTELMRKHPDWAASRAFDWAHNAVSNFDLSLVK
jgi:hypothetical protein